jgi:MerR family transcriptional regulator, heat shock protein HspR
MARRGNEQRPDESQDDRAVYVISVAAELAGVHPQTLRIYERKGLLRPQRTAGNSRRYSARDIARLRAIQRLTQEEGVNLAGVRMIVEMEIELERMREEAERLSAELMRQRRRLVEETERFRRGSAPTEIVPVSSITRFRITKRGGEPHQGPIPLGPGGHR